MAKKEIQEAVIRPEFEDTKSPDYKYVYATGVFGGLNPNGGQMLFYLDRFVPETIMEPLGGLKVKKIVRELQVEIHVSPTQFKTMANWMNEHIKHFEQTFGEIPLEPKSKVPPPPSSVYA
jgi:hypothetical protein